MTGQTTWTVSTEANWPPLNHELFLSKLRTNEETSNQRECEKWNYCCLPQTRKQRQKRIKKEKQSGWKTDALRAHHWINTAAVNHLRHSSTNHTPAHHWYKYKTQRSLSHSIDWVRDLKTCKDVKADKHHLNKLFSSQSYIH